MKGDFSRDTFDKAKHFSRILMQQGRVQLDSDWNEQSAILIHYLRTLATDIIGSYGGPKDNWGFEINNDSTVSDDFTIGEGRYYVDGILCENDADANLCKKKVETENAELTVTYKNQKFYPNPPDLPTEKNFLVYLDVWEQHVTALEDDDIREKALGGPDTAGRARVVWQVKIDNGSTEAESIKLELGDCEPVVASWKDWKERWQPFHRGCLKVRVNPPEETNDQCLTKPTAKYRGKENQLYRVEIHKGGKAGTATFKWSRDNGSIVTSCELKGRILKVKNSTGFTADQWVELTNDEQELRGEPGKFVRISKGENDQFTVEKIVQPPDSVPGNEVWPTKVRRWDQLENEKTALCEGAISVNEGTGNDHWIDLEDGIQIQFQPPDEGQCNNYRTGDYWFIPARIATGNIEWPVEMGEDDQPVLDDRNNPIPIPKPPDGIEHHYAPLAILPPKGNGTTKPEDCRCEFSPLKCK